MVKMTHTLFHYFLNLCRKTEAISTSTSRIVFALFGYQAKEHRTVNISILKIKLRKSTGQSQIVAWMKSKII